MGMGLLLPLVELLAGLTSAAVAAWVLASTAAAAAVAASLSMKSWLAMMAILMSALSLLSSSGVFLELFLGLLAPLAVGGLAGAGGADLRAGGADLDSAGLCTAGLTLKPLSPVVGEVVTSSLTASLAPLGSGA